jgi:negative regulator of sigma E activity
MSKESLEHLSSLMDGELSRETSLFLTRRLASDEAMCDTWERYHLIRDCIRQPGSKQIVSGLCVDFMVEEEAHIQTGRQ